MERIRGERPGVKAIFVSGYHDLPAVGGREALANLTIIEKPFRADKLLSAVRAELVPT